MKTEQELWADIAAEDARVLVEKNRSYGSSWCRRGGTGAFMVSARKWDRLEEQVKKMNYDIFMAIGEDPRQEGVIDDIRDLRRYLLLIEAKVTAMGLLKVAPMAVERKTSASNFTPSRPDGQERPFGYIPEDEQT